MTTEHDPFRGVPRRGSAYPEGGTVEAITRWAGDDPDRIRQAIDAEQARSSQRKGVLALADKLEA